MSAIKLGVPKLYAEHEPDQGAPLGHLRPDSVEVGAGHIAVGVEISGVKKVLYRFKAGGFLQDLERASKKSGA